jgi:phosphate transport system substrate-binding protein
MRRALAVTVTAGMLLAGLAPCAIADTIKMHGATTVLDVVVNPVRAAVEKSTGHTLEIVANATGKGLVDLVHGKAEVTMVSEPLDIAVAAAKVAGETIDPKTLQFHVVRNDEIVFVVHPSNPVTKLTLEQIGDIHTGKITNWKQVGGKDQAITVYSDAVTGGTRAMIKKLVMGGNEYAQSVKSLTSVSRVPQVVAKDESGIGGVGRGFTEGLAVKLIQSSKVERPLGFVTLGDPSPKVRQMIEAFKTTVTRK